MPTMLGFVLAVTGLLMIGFSLFSVSEPAVAVSSLSNEHRQLLREELKAFGGGDVPLPKLNDMLVQAAQRLQAEKLAIEARAAKRDAERQASLVAELQRRTEAYRRHVPDELQVVIARKVAAEARAKAEVSLDVPKLRSTIEQLTTENAELRGLWERAQAQIEATRASVADLPSLRAELSQVSTENEELRERLERSTAQAQAAAQVAAGTTELHGQVIELSAENADLKRVLEEYCRERQHLIRLLEEGVTRPFVWRVTPSPSRSGLY